MRTVHSRVYEISRSSAKEKNPSKKEKKKKCNSTLNIIYILYYSHNKKPLQTLLIRWPKIAARTKESSAWWDNFKPNSSMDFVTPFVRLLIGPNFLTIDIVHCRTTFLSNSGWDWNVNTFLSRLNIPWIEVFELPPIDRNPSGTHLTQSACTHSNESFSFIFCDATLDRYVAASFSNVKEQWPVVVLL